MRARRLRPARQLRGAAGLLVAAWLTALAGCGAADQSPGVIEGRRRPDRSPGGSASQILFGDLHVHTTYSIDAFLYSLPMFMGEGAHPPADACDFARYCSALDFFAIADHAEGLTPERWSATQESIRECNARAGDPGNPDLVALLGWEWTQVGLTPETHYGHKNVIFPSDEVPVRPITALREDVFAQAPPRGLLRLGEVLAPGGYGDFLWWLRRLADLPNCPRNVPTRELPPDCRENAPTPAELFRKLDEWGLDALVIPHGLAWGIHAPPGARLDNQLRTGQHDARRQRLVEVFSGHGNGEEYRPWLERSATGAELCPEPTPDFLPCCWRAGEIMRERCGDLPEAECQARVEAARRLALEGGVAPNRVFPDTSVADWLDCDQCRDCFKTVFAPRPGESAQYSLAVSREPAAESDTAPRRFRWGFIASSDDHHARPGTGYKQVQRLAMSDARGLRSAFVEKLVRRVSGRSGADPQEPQAVEVSSQSLGALVDVERGASFMYPGGLVAVHAEGRSREALWSALVGKEVYGTSGPRILLWFDLLNGPEGRVPMGGEVALAEAPRFEVRALGAFRQQPGCPAQSLDGLSPERLARLCRGECHHPGDERHAIEAIEVVRVRPRVAPGEAVALLIEDPWRRLPCTPDPAGCVVRFEDPDFAGSGRDTVYYVRALQVETPAINAANLRTEFDAAGNPRSVAPCYGDWRTPADDDCLAPARERAWSSPIYVDQDG